MPISGAHILELSADDAKLVKSFLKLIRLNKKLKEELRNVKRVSKETGTTADRAFKKMGAQIRQVTAALGLAGGLAGAVQLVRKEYQTLEEVQLRAATSQNRLAAAHQSVIRNLQGKSDQETQQFLADLKTLSRQTGVSEVHLSRAAAQAVSASAQNIPASYAAVRQAAILMPEDPQIVPYAGALLDLSKVTGTYDAQVNQGVLQQVAALSRLADPRSQAMHIPRALIGMTQFGATYQEAVALYAAQTTEGADVEGRISGTAQVALAEQLQEYFRTNRSARSTEAEYGYDPGMASMLGRIEMLWDNPRMAQSFWDYVSFEKKAKGPLQDLILGDTAGGKAVEGLLTGGRYSGFADQLRANLAATPTFESAAAYAQDSIRRRGLSPVEPAAQVDRALMVLQEQAQVSDTSKGVAGVFRDKLVPALKDLGLSNIDSNVEKIFWEIQGGLEGGPGALSSGIGTLTRREQMLRSPEPIRTDAVGPGGAFNPLGGSLYSPQASGQDVELANIAREQVNKLQDIHDSLNGLGRVEEQAEQAPPPEAARQNNPQHPYLYDSSRGYWKAHGYPGT